MGSDQTTYKRTASDPGRQQTFGRYVLLRRLAAGGMAEIFLAKQTGISGFERLVVIKRILPHLSTNREFITMFLDEARTAAQLSHPNIVQIYDMGQVGDSYYIAMEYIHGEDLRRVYNQEVQRGSRIPWHIAAHLLAQAAQGLDYAHRKSDISGTPLHLVHRDISPQNLLVSYDGHVKVVDFGVAKASKNEALTRSGVLKGKYSYMSPEQAQGNKIDSRTDVFALAVVLYEVTVGERLFKRTTENETLQAVIACDVPPPSKIDGKYPPELERVIMKALSKTAPKRYATAGDLARDLEEFVHKSGERAGPQDLADYLQDLFADKLADEQLLGNNPMWDEDHTDAFKKEQQKRLRKRDAELPEVSAHALIGDDEPATKPEVPSRSRALGDDEVNVVGAQSDWSTPRQGIGERAASPPPRIGAAGAPTQSRLMSAFGPIVIGLGGVAVVAMLVFGGAKTPGPVMLDSRPPGAAIFVDGVKLAVKTPATIDPPLAIGPHVVRYELQGYEPTDGALIVHTGGKNTFELELKPVAVAEQPPPAPIADKHAQLSVHASIPLKVFNGKTALGTTPLQKPLPPGSYTLRLEHEPSGWSETRKVTLKEGATEKIDVQVALGKLRVNIQPFGNVKVGNISGETPLAPIDLPAGKYSVRLWNSELKKEEKVSVVINGGKETSLERSWTK